MQLGRRGEGRGGLFPRTNSIAVIMLNDVHYLRYCGHQLFRKDLISAMKLADSEALRRDDYVMISDHWRQDWEKGVQVPVNPDVLKHSQVTYV